jgi:hypothetical protein
LEKVLSENTATLNLLTLQNQKLEVCLSAWAEEINILCVIYPA